MSPLNKCGGALSEVNKDVLGFRLTFDFGIDRKDFLLPDDSFHEFILNVSFKDGTIQNFKSKKILGSDKTSYEITAIDPDENREGWTTFSQNFNVDQATFVETMSAVIKNSYGASSPVCIAVIDLMEYGKKTDHLSGAINLSAALNVVNETGIFGDNKESAKMMEEIKKKESPSTNLVNKGRVQLDNNDLVHE